MTYTTRIEDNILHLTGAENQTRFHAVWLRDNLPGAAYRDPGNGQRLVTLANLPEVITLASADVNNDAIDICFDGDETVHSFALSWLLDHAYDTAEIPDLNPGITAWTAALTDVPTGDITALKTDKSARLDWLSQVETYGFAKVTGMEPVEGGLFDIADLFGYVRETNYGRHFEVRTEVNPVNLAYTGLGLQAHTDNPYRDPVPTLQILACLENSAAGGENMVVDGFACAQRLREEDPEGFDALASYSIRFEYAGSSDVRLQSWRPMIELSPEGTFIQMRFNSRSIGPVQDVPFEAMEIWYRAYRRLSAIIDDPAMEVTFKLSPGEAFIVDNTRVLHARKGYSGEGSRWLQGCYADKDGLRSTRAALAHELGDA
ncbi:TauD/TfdA family dioxygenase [Halocynthiibacter namhaensis]|uniref:2-trimethylaminoethylphosphonate dioxygenase n=1 Tax=Halocynthiibacter namhaensis TaxID=1290553 RepID=UPI0005797D66|nr:TauD/TfdA family dioxygenase [Halocynthiibacter namhaensis]